MTKLIVAFRNFANALKNDSIKEQVACKKISVCINKQFATGVSRHLYEVKCDGFIYKMSINRRDSIALIGK
jgi:hypothetical protein